MADYLIEIIFRNVPSEKIEGLLKDLSSNGNSVVDYYFTCSTTEIDWNVEKSIEKTFSDNVNFGLFLNLDELRRDGLCLPNCGIAVYKDERSINVELGFKLSDLKSYNIENLARDLMQWSKSVAAKYHIIDYFCGLEPAQDVQTRLFTNEQLGPLFLKNSTS